MSKQREQFVASYLQPEDSEQSETAQEERAFKFEDLIYQNPSIQRGFSYDSEKARNFDQSNVKKAKEGVMEMLKDAMNKAKRQVNDLKAKARKEGYDTGFEGGFKKGKDTAQEEFSPFLQTTQSLIEDLSGFRKEMYDKLEREMIEMVISLAKKVIHFEFSTREDAVQDMIRLAVQSVLDRESMVIKINPTDKEYAESFRPELHHLFSEIKNITFEAHSGIARGGCVIETNFGVIDARIEKLEEQINRILNLSPAPPEKLIEAAQVSEEPVTEIKNEEPQSPDAPLPDTQGRETETEDPKTDPEENQE